MKENFFKKDPSILDVNNVKAAVLGATLSYIVEDSNSGSRFEKYKTQLINQLKTQNETLERMIPFYKKGDDVNQAGYIIETDKKIMLCYHGTQIDKFFTSGSKEVLHDLQIQKAKMKFGNEEGGVHLGFKKEYESSKEDMLRKLRGVCTSNNKQILCTGHSLGGAVSQIAALDLESNNAEFRDRISSVITFGSPRVFYNTAAKIYNKFKLNLKTLRVEQKFDIVPKIIPKGVYADTGFAIEMHAKPDKTFYTKTHSAGVYRDIVDSIVKDKSVKEEALKASLAPVTIEEYCKSIMNLAQKQFLELLVSVQRAIKSDAFIQKYAAPFLKRIPAPKARKKIQDSKNTVR